MAWKRGATYSGGSGQMAVFGELLHRKCNAAIPHIDNGMDVFAFKDDREDVARIQVKMANGSYYANGSGYTCKFIVPLKLLKRADDPPLYYALIIRLDDHWGPTIVVSRTKLYELWNNGMGRENLKSKSIELKIKYKFEVGNAGNEADLPDEFQVTATCDGTELSDYVDAWETLPPLKEIAALPN